MSYIPLAIDAPGIVGLLETYTDTGKILRNLADTLLNKNTDAFNKAERETVASYVSFLNNCNFCHKSHSAVADCLWNEKGKTHAIINESAVDGKMNVLMKITKKLHESPQGLKKNDIDSLTAFDFTPSDINDLILIISAFCMFNRYVDGLGTTCPSNDEMYIKMGKQMAKNGYIK